MVTGALYSVSSSCGGEILIEDPLDWFLFLLFVLFFVFQICTLFVYLVGLITGCSPLELLALISIFLEKKRVFPRVKSFLGRVCRVRCGSRAGGKD